MNIHPRLYNQHCNCDVYVDIFPKNKQGQLITAHAGALRCRTHNKWLKWISMQELGQLQDLVEADQ
jgi:hypothetical protein